jgi:type III secretion protein J
LLLGSSTLAALVGCERVPVQGALPEREANEIVLLLEEAGLPARKDREGTAGGGGRQDRAWSVTVSASDAGRALQVLSDNALPHESPPGFSEVLSGDSLIPTASEERVRHQQALAGELARSLESVRGVIEARVHLALPEAALLPTLEAAAVAPTASVLLRISTPSPPLPVDEVKRLVAGAVPGLSATAVNVVVVPEVPPTRPPTDGLVSIAGIRVSPSSAAGMRVILGAALVVIVLLAGGLVTVTIRRRIPRLQKGTA